RSWRELCSPLVDRLDEFGHAVPENPRTPVDRPPRDAHDLADLVAGLTSGFGDRVRTHVLTRFCLRTFLVSATRLHALPGLLAVLLLQRRAPRPDHRPLTRGQLPAFQVERQDVGHRVGGRTLAGGGRAARTAPPGRGPRPRSPAAAS